ncbi:MAG: cell division protein FtsZ [Nanoarchaeota archaeon]|nr:cell division protein FtsZ [Nanoarchaeota archaeon]
MDFIVQNALKNTNEINWEEGLLGQANIKVIGVGGAGNNMADWLYRKGVRGAEIISANTDKQHLDAREADIKILIGKDVTRGLGAGGYPQKGEEAARESSQELKDALKNCDMLFLCAGMGGGTGTGAAAPIAKIAKEMGAIVIGVVTMPFKIEKARIDKAEWGLKQLRQVSDTVIVIDNNRLVDFAGSLPIAQAFAVANELVATMIKGIVETIAIPSLVNLDFADVKAIMNGGDVSVIGVGESDTEGRVKEAVNKALMNPLLDVSYEGSTGALIHICGGPDLTLEEVNQIGEMVTASLDPDAQVIWGARILDNMSGKLRVMTIVTGVTSPFILGPTKTAKQDHVMRSQVSEELGIRML